MNSELNLDFVYCYRCYRQPIGQDDPFVVCICKHIFCNKCKRCDYNRTADSIYCFVCRKPVKFKPITPQDLPVNVQSNFESTSHLMEKFQKSAEFQGNIQHKYTDQLLKDIEYWDKVGDEEDAIAKELEARCQQLEHGISTVEENSLQHMSRERYTQLLNMSDDEIDRMNYRQLVGTSRSDGHTHSTPRPSVPVIDPHTPLLRQVLLKNAYSSHSSSHSPN